MSSWVTRTPAIRDRLDLSTAHLGLVLFGLSPGSMAGISCSGRLVSKSGTRPVIGCVAFLLGPPGLGFLGGQVGLRPAMLVVPACVVCAAFLAPAVETGARRTAACRW